MLEDIKVVTMFMRAGLSLAELWKNLEVGSGESPSLWNPLEINAAPLGT